MKSAWKPLAAVLVFSCVQSAQAAPLFFDVTLQGSLEVPSNASLGTGSADITLDPALNTLLVDVTFSGLSGTTTASHIHCCLASPFLKGVNAGVATAVPTFTGFPLGVTSGTYNHLFDMTLASSYNPAFMALHGGTPAGAEAALFAGIEDGESYLNIHSSTFPGGEIRGFLVSVPEPITLSLFGAGLAGAAVLRRRKKNKD